MGDEGLAFFRKYSIKTASFAAHRHRSVVVAFYLLGFGFYEVAGGRGPGTN